MHVIIPYLTERISKNVPYRTIYNNILYIHYAIILSTVLHTNIEISVLSMWTCKCSWPSKNTICVKEKYKLYIGWEYIMIYMKKEILEKKYISLIHY